MIINKSDSIMVTGASGWLGNYVVKELKSRGYDNLSLLYGRSDVDLTDETETFDEVYYNRPKHIIHLAAKVGGIAENMANPIEFFADNMRMGLNLIEAALRYNVVKFLLVSTVCSYPAFSPIPFHPKDLWINRPEPTNEPYGLAKKSLSFLLEKARDKMCGITVIPTNLIGPNFDEDSHVVPQVIEKVHLAKKNNTDLVLFGTGQSSREFLYVEDCARGIVDAFEKYEGVEPLNLGNGEEITIKDLVDKITKIMGYTGNITWDSSKPDGQLRRLVDSSLAHQMGWFARISTEEALRRTIEWYLCDVENS